MNKTRTHRRGIHIAAILLVALAACPVWPKEPLVLAEPGDPALTLVLAPEAASCVRIAAEDLARDFEQVAGVTLTLAEAPPEGDAPFIMAGTVGCSPLLEGFSAGAGLELDALRGQWESFVIAPAALPGGRAVLLIIGSDARATMYGLYQVSHRVLGVDPLHYWTGQQPESPEQLAWTDGVYRSGEPAFRFRGIFINDEDRLMGWKGEPGDRHVEPEVWEPILETLCRLRGNMIAPAMYADYMDPATRRRVDARGLLYTASHLEILLTNPQNYWGDFTEQTYGEFVPYSYTSHPEKLEAFWRESIQRQQGHANLWPVGLRGTTDHAFWDADPTAPRSLAERARVVDRAVAAQVRLLHEALDPEPFTAVMNTRTEVLDLLKTGEISLPPEVILVWDDWAKTGVMRRLPGGGDEFGTARHGVYHHLTASQSQWVRSLPLETLWAEFRRIIDAGTTEYALFNVGDLREFLQTLEAAMQITWEGRALLDSIDPGAWLRQWCARRYGESVADEIAALYERFMELENRCRVVSTFESVAPLTASMQLHAIWNELSALDLIEQTGRPELLAAYARMVDFTALPDRYWTVTPHLLRHQRELWDELLAKAVAVVGQVEPRSRALYRDDLLTQLQTSRLVNAWACEVLAAFEACGARDFAGAADRFEAAAERLVELDAQRARSAQGKWDGWYRGEYDWPNTFWKLKPAWHEKDARKLAIQCRQAAESTAQLEVIEPAPARLTVNSHRAARTVAAFDLAERPSDDARVIIMGMCRGLTSEMNGQVRLGEHAMALRPVDSRREQAFVFEVPPSATKVGENLIELSFEEPHDGAVRGFEVHGLSLSILTGTH